MPSPMIFLKKAQNVLKKSVMVCCQTQKNYYDFAKITVLITVRVLISFCTFDSVKMHQMKVSLMYTVVMYQMLIPQSRVKSRL